MKRQTVTLLMVLALAMGTAVWAQSTGTTQALPPSQQVDQSGEPEQGTGLDVDVDAGRNAEDGLVDVEVNNETDSDTAAQGNDNAGTAGQTDTTTRTGTTPPAGTTRSTTGTMGTGTTGSSLNNDQDDDVTATGTATGTAGTYGGTETGSDLSGDTDSLPETASNTPLFALLGLLSLAGAFVVRMVR